MTDALEARRRVDQLLPTRGGCMASRCFAVFPAFLAVGLVVGCDSRAPFEAFVANDAALSIKGGPKTGSGFATLSTLPPLPGGQHGEAYAVNQAGAIVAGYSWDSADRMNPVTWTLQNGAWTITALPYAASATSAVARGVNDQGDVAGNHFPSSAPHAVLWPFTGGFNVLGCGDLGEVYAISAGAQILVGVGRDISPVSAAVWQPGACREDLPALFQGGSASANAVNGNGTIVGGRAAPDALTSAVPVRWRRVAGAWQIEQLDSRPGAVYGANPAGDLVGSVQVSCGSASSCNRGIIWYADGHSRELGTLGGESTTPRAINAAGEVVGSSTVANGDGFPFFWSETASMRQLPVRYGGSGFAISGVRADGTRLVVGAGGRPFAALAWVVRNP
jgi:uncharacterized membrane protein